MLTIVAKIIIRSENSSFTRLNHARGHYRKGKETCPLVLGFYEFSEVLVCILTK